MKSKNNLNLSHCCFDLDGTLVDSNKTIYEATTHTLNKLNIIFNIDEELFATKIGQHFNDIFNVFNIDVPSFDEFINIYKANYFEQMHYSTLYDGVEETLAALKNKNIKISLLTTKVQDQADKILEYFNLTKYFDLVMGRRDGIAHKPSPEPLQIICKDLSIDLKNTLMVGDTEMDIQCGKNAGSFTCGVIYGYRTRELIKIENPDYIVDSLNEILTIV